MLFEFTERGFIRAGYCTSRRPSVAIRSRDFGLNWLDFYVIQLLEDEIERLLSGSNGLVSLIKKNVTGFSKPSDLNIVWSGGLSGRSHFRPLWFLWKEILVFYKDIRR